MSAAIPAEIADKGVSEVLGINSEQISEEAPGGVSDGILVETPGDTSGKTLRRLSFFL